MVYNINDFRPIIIADNEWWNTEQVCKLTNITNDDLIESFNYQHCDIESPLDFIVDNNTCLWSAHGVKCIMKYFMDGDYIEKYNWLVYHDLFEDYPDTFTD